MFNNANQYEEIGSWKIRKLVQKQWLPATAMQHVVTGTIILEAKTFTFGAVASG
ncbi:hypothetical protein PMHK_57590 [Pseudomonas sp. MHK4]